MGLVDLHSHVLPALDDGVESDAEALEALARLQQLGFEIVCATPHQKLGSFVPALEAIDTAHARIQGALVERGLPLSLYRGAENFWDELFLGRAQDDQVPSYTGGLAFLVEIAPALPPPRLEEALFRLRARGRLPVLAHPERYHSLCRDRRRLEALRATSALVVDLGALDGAHGPVAGEAARMLVKEGLAHACASDIHDPDDAPRIGAGLAWIRKKLGAAAVTRLVDEAPRQILQGALPD